MTDIGAVDEPVYTSATGCMVVIAMAVTSDTMQNNYNREIATWTRRRWRVIFLILSHDCLWLIYSPGEEGGPVQMSPPKVPNGFYTWHNRTLLEYSNVIWLLDNPQRCTNSSPDNLMAPQMCKWPHMCQQPLDVTMAPNVLTVCLTSYQPTRCANVPWMYWWPQINQHVPEHTDNPQMDLGSIPACPRQEK